MASRDRSVYLVWLPAVLAMLVTGCNWGTPELGTVTGTVTMDGEPLKDAQVEFQPQRRFPPSYGTTDSLGHYELQYTKDKPGAVVGTHTVRITTQTTGRDESGNEIQVPQRVPEKYNDRSQLIKRVQSGENVISFALESEPKTEEPKEGEVEPAEPDSEKAEAETPDAETPDAGPAGTAKAQAEQS